MNACGLTSILSISEQCEHLFEQSDINTYSEINEPV